MKNQKVSRKNKNLRYTLWTILGIILLGVIGVIGATYTINQDGVFVDGNKSYARTADIVVCRGTSLADDIIKSFQCDVVCKSTDTIGECTTILNNTLKTGNQKIYIRQGNYTTSSSLIIGSNTTITGDFGYLTHFSKTGNYDIFEITTKNNIDISGSYFDGVASTNGKAMDIQTSSSNINIHNNIFDNWNTQHPVGVGNSEYITLAYNKVGDGSGFGAEGGVTNMKILFNDFIEASNDYAIIFNGNTNDNSIGIIEGNTIPFGTVLAGGGIDVAADNVIIKDNYISNTFKNGILVRDNKALGGNDNITNIIIEGNIIVNVTSGQRGLSFSNTNSNHSAYIQINNNYFDQGMSMNGIQNAKITNNYLVNNGFYTLASNRITFSGNTIKNSDYVINIEPTYPYLNNSLIYDNELINVSSLFYGNRVPLNSYIKEYTYSGAISAQFCGLLNSTTSERTIHNSSTSCTCTGGAWKCWSMT